MNRIYTYAVAILLFFMSFRCEALQPSLVCPSVFGSKTQGILEYEDFNSTIDRIDGARGTLNIPENEATKELAKRNDCWKQSGPRARWRIANKKLWLVSLVEDRGHETKLDRIYGGAGDPIFAGWFSGDLTIDRGKQLCAGLWDTRTTIYISKGRVAEITEHRTFLDPSVPTEDEKRRLNKEYWTHCLSNKEKEKLRGDDMSAPDAQEREEGGRYPYPPEELWNKLLPALQISPKEMTYPVFQSLLGLKEISAVVQRQGDKQSREYFQATKGSARKPSSFPFGELRLSRSQDASDYSKSMLLEFDLFGEIVGYLRFLEESGNYCMRLNVEDVEALGYRYLGPSDIKSTSSLCKIQAWMPCKEEVFVDDRRSDIRRLAKFIVLPNGCISKMAVQGRF